MIVCLLSLRILCIRCDKGHIHDFKLYKKSKLSINPKAIKYVDLGYKGIKKETSNVNIPFKKSKKKKLTKKEKKYNKELSKLRVKIEHVNRKCKIFRIVKDTYRGKHKNYGLIWNIVAGLVNSRHCNYTIIY